MNRKEQDEIYEGFDWIFDDKKKIYFTAVGMKYHGNYLFDGSEKIFLERERDNPADSNAIKVLVARNESKARDHVAYVRKIDTNRFSSINDLKELKVYVLCHSCNAIGMKAVLNFVT